MYKKFFSRQNRNQNFRRFNARGNSGTRRIKSFDPSELVNNPQEKRITETYTVTHAFSDFNINGQLLNNIIEKGYKVPSPIQDQSIIPILEGRDLVGIANTGTGKTAAFLIPLINKIIKNRSEKVLVLTPTRELATQIKNEFVSFTKQLNIYASVCVGGENMHRQISDLRRNPNFVIATPGRLQDLIRNRVINLHEFNNVVLDEADRMLDIGFLKDIKIIVSMLPRERQSLFFSATMDSDVRQILNSFVNNPVTVSVKTGETTDNIKQMIVKVSDPSQKIQQLHELLISEGFEKVLIFGRTKHGVQRLSDELVDRGFKAGAIHGNKRQTQRIRTLEMFKNNQIKVLIATDVASRGLDIPNVSHVINYDLPESKESYIHRIGRTGRMDKTGVALTFI